VFVHSDLPCVGGAGEPPGAWLAGALEGLYEAWMAAQPGAEPGLVARRVAGAAAEEVVVRYARG
jgi:branched-subunit amino acid ABC-type transport system permease component